MAQRVVVVQILVAEREAKDPLQDQCLDLVLDELPHAPIREAAGETRDQADRPVGRAEQQRAGIRGDDAAIERGDHGAPFDRWDEQRFRATLCRHRGALPQSGKSFSQNNFP